MSVARRAPGSHFTYLVYQLREGTEGNPEYSAKDQRTAELPRPGWAGTAWLLAAVSPCFKDCVKV